MQLIRLRGRTAWQQLLHMHAFLLMSIPSDITWTFVSNWDPEEHEVFAISKVDRMRL